MTLIACIAILLGGIFCARDVHGTFCSGGSLSSHTGFCYHVHAKKKSKIEDARLVCRNDYGGDIPSIFTGDENTFIHDLLTTEGSQSHYWIGVSDLYVEDSFRDFMLNEELTYSNWESEEPYNASGFDCAKMEVEDGKWVACPCKKDSEFDEGVICQQPPDPNPFTLCPANMLPYTTPLYTECYWFSMDTYKALDASLECAAMGSKLAFIKNQALNDFIHSYQESSKLNTVWIGTQQISDIGGQTNLSVKFGTTIPAYYDNFISEYSGSESPVCAAMKGTEAGKWNHLSCDDARHPFVCRYNATVYSQNTTYAATTIGSTTTMASTPPTTTPSPTTTEAAITEATTIPTTTPSSNTTDFTIPLPNATTTTASPTTTEPTTSEAATILPISTPNTTHSPATTEPTTSEATTTLPTTTPTTTHSPTTTEGTTTLSTTTATPTTSPSTAESTTTLPTTTPTTNVIISQSTTTESTTSQSTTQEGSSSVGSTTPTTTTTEPTPTTSETTTPTVGMSTEETDVRYSNCPACLEVLKALREPTGSPRRRVVERIPIARTPSSSVTRTGPEMVERTGNDLNISNSAVIKVISKVTKCILHK